MVLLSNQKSNETIEHFSPYCEVYLKFNISLIGYQ